MAERHGKEPTRRWGRREPKQGEDKLSQREGKEPHQREGVGCRCSRVRNPSRAWGKRRLIFGFYGVFKVHIVNNIFTVESVIKHFTVNNLW